jgi:3-phenylpropionate/trans-cinnamate dioxygenase ferredoxin component
MGNFVDAALLDDVPEGTGKAVEIAGKPVALFNVGGQIYAIDDTCPHFGASLGGSGKLQGRVVTCSMHGMRIDVVTGCFPASQGFAVASYPVMVVAGMIRVAVVETGPESEV